MCRSAPSLRLHPRERSLELSGVFRSTGEELCVRHNGQPVGAFRLGCCPQQRPQGVDNPPRRARTSGDVWTFTWTSVWTLWAPSSAEACRCTFPTRFDTTNRSQPPDADVQRCSLFLWGEHPPRAWNDNGCTINCGTGNFQRLKFREGQQHSDDFSGKCVTLRQP